ncbi:hypothetical protein LDG_6191 [Legionella drancourtii LLAP12]|uniref:Uncharacterized protein n=1 Tax=Legionella drancourtii LLAP12 TaxID=658187 RepID=G9ELC8_9GAMM|nr:hypothetical protein LDG_6191 [Legionella drancourtii LLAP12]
METKCHRGNTMTLEDFIIPISDFIANLGLITALIHQGHQKPYAYHS